MHQAGDGHVLFDDEALLARLQCMFDGVADVPDDLAEVLRSQYSQWVLGEPASAADPKLVEAPVSLARTESMVRSWLKVHATGDDGAWQVARELNDMLDDLDGTPGLDEVMDKLARAATRTRQLGEQLG